MKQVSKEYFNNKVLRLDVVLSVLGSFPFTVEYKYRNGQLVGRTVERYGKDGEEYIEEDYFTDL